ncbi:2-dehydropantoate 2-reductase [Erysipelothrix sp. HDW6A]|uniref:ketopantoate reductase family protein n=1 Tax=Erysipelothrix sp. HDW6A TaxID=2714928 RepID=UPI00140CB624|nr:2-dehydropantoate 2-reductase [Erysipelothrix sp. HDW6A]QIK57104.1 2-dehydropantoate 2-reductase [Erysipelothrix sp. HDW6A]
MKILVAGAGAMGSRFAYMLVKSGNDVVITDSWKQHIDVINNKGLKVLIDGYNMGTYRLPAFLPNEVHGEFDLIILLTKAMQLESMLQDIKHVFSDNTLVINLVSGLGNAEQILEYVTMDRLYVASNYWTAGLGGPGVVDAVGEGTIKLQIYKNDSSQYDEQVIDVLNSAGFRAKLSHDVFLDIWKELAVSSVINPMCAILDCTIAQFGAYKGNVEISRLILDEIVEVAKHENVVLNIEDILDKISSLFPDTVAGRHYPSMHQDLMTKRNTEIDYLNGYIVQLGLKYDVLTPINSIIRHQIKLKEQLNEGSKKR